MSRANPAPKPVVGPVALVPRPGSAGRCHAATLTELDDAGRTETALGQAALALAERIDAQVDTGSALAAAAKQLQATLAAALEGAEPANLSRLDQMRNRRDRKRA